MNINAYKQTSTKVVVSAQNIKLINDNNPIETEVDSKFNVESRHERGLMG